MKQLMAGAISLVVGMLMLASPLEAALLYLDPSEATINPGDTVVVSVRINPDADECINVVDGVLEYDPQIQPVDISLGQSIFSLWVEEPVIDRENNRITWAGGIPNGYCGRIQGDPRLTNEVMKIVFQVPGMRVGFGDNNPTTTLAFSDQTTVYLNDGRGSVAPLQTNQATLVVGTRPGEVVQNEWSRLVNGDEDVPEEFSITLQKTDNAFQGKYFIIFNTTDKQTGIAYYEVIEEPLEEAGLFGWGAADAPWRKVRSPYILEDQSLNSTIRVRAVDKAGNTYVATLVPDQSLRSISTQTYIEYSILIGGGLLVTLALLWLGYWFGPRVQARRKARRERRQAAQAEEGDTEYEYVEEWVEVEVDEDGNEIN